MNCRPMLFFGLVFAGVKARPVGLLPRQWLDFLQRPVTAARQFLVLRGSPRFPVHLFVAEAALYLCRIANQHTPGRALETRFNKGSGGNQRLGTNQGVVHNHRVHADQCVAPNATAVQNGAVADMGIFLNDAVFSREAVHHAGVLQVAAPVHLHPTKVSAQNRAGANVAIGADNHIANQNGGWMNKGAGINNGYQVFDGVNGHIFWPVSK